MLALLFRSLTSAAIASLAVLSLATFPGATAGAKELPEEVAAVVAEHEATLAKIETLHLKAAQRTAQLGGELKLYQETEWWRSGDRERFTNVMFLDPVSGERYDPARREEKGFDAKEIRVVELGNSDDVRKTPLLPTGADAAVFARARGTIMPLVEGIRHPLLLQLLFQPNGASLRSYLEEATEAKVLSRTEDAIVLEMTRPTYRELLEFAPEQGHLIRRAEWQVQDAPRDQHAVTEIEFAESNGIAFPVNATTRRGEGKPLLEIKISDLAINEPLEPVRATVRFPEGGSVERFDGQKVTAWYVWGKDEPRLTFESQAAYDGWLRGAISGANEE